MVRVQPPIAPVSEERFLAYQRVVGNDAAVGLVLPELLERAGLEVETVRGTSRVGRRVVGTRPATWAARRATVTAGVAAEEDLERWAREFVELDARPVQPWMVACGASRTDGRAVKGRRRLLGGSRRADLLAGECLP
jgi:hypothetical protein